MRSTGAPHAKQRTSSSAGQGSRSGIYLVAKFLGCSQEAFDYIDDGGFGTIVRQFACA